MVLIEISSDIKAKFENLYLGAALIRNVNSMNYCSELLSEIKRVENWVRNNFNLKTLKDMPIIRAYRDFYWRVKIDPTKQRPSAEALIRRILRGKGLPRINCAVDVYNIVSILTQISIGAYDYNKIVEPIILRWSKEGEEFWGIGDKKRRITKQPVIADREKIINLYPHRDSELTKITNETKNILIITCGVPGISRKNLIKTAEMAGEYTVKFCGGEIVELKIID